MHRIKWLKVEWNQKYNTVIDAILNDSYNDEKQYGFKAHKRRDRFLNATYIFKKEIEEIIENPFTNESIVYQKIVYEQTTFTLEDNELGIEIHNPPRTIQSLLNNFASMSKFNITIKPIELDLSECITRLKTNFTNIVVSEIECSNIKLEEHTTVKIIAKNKVSDTLQDIKSFLDKKIFTIEKIKCNFTIDSISGSFELTKNGSLKTNKSNLEVLLPIIKFAIQSQD
jgi:hypothetical protein